MHQKRYGMALNANCLPVGLRRLLFRLTGILDWEDVVCAHIIPLSIDKQLFNAIHLGVFDPNP